MTAPYDAAECRVPDIVRQSGICICASRRENMDTCCSKVLRIHLAYPNRGTSQVKLGTPLVDTSAPSSPSSSSLRDLSYEWHHPASLLALSGAAFEVFVSSHRISVETGRLRIDHNFATQQRSYGKDHGL